jgi:hypothetical protein
MDNARRGEPIPNIPETGRFFPAMDAALEAITNGRQSVKEALDGAAARMLVRMSPPEAPAAPAPQGGQRPGGAGSAAFALLAGAAALALLWLVFGLYLPGQPLWPRPCWWWAASRSYFYASATHAGLALPVPRRGRHAGVRGLPAAVHDADRLHELLVQQPADRRACARLPAGPDLADETRRGRSRCTPKAARWRLLLRRKAARGAGASVSPPLALGQVRRSPIALMQPLAGDAPDRRWVARGARPARAR